jgi:hypothetical protein
MANNRRESLKAHGITFQNINIHPLSMYNFNPGLYLAVLKSPTIEPPA